MASRVVLFAALGASLLWAGIAGWLGAQSDHQLLRNYREPNDYEAHIVITMGYVRGSSEANDVVALGDSTCFTDFRPVAFEERTGLRAYNIATVGVVGIDGLERIFRDYLDHHPKPRLLIFCMHPWALGVDPAATGPGWIRDQFEVSYADVSRQAIEPRIPARLQYYIRQGLWFIYGETTGGLRRQVKAPIAHRQGANLEALAASVQRNRGFFEQPGVMDPSLRPREAVGPFPVLVSSVQAVDAIINLASAHGVKVLIRLTPALIGGPDPESQMIHAWIARLTPQFANVLVGQPEVVMWGPAEFGERLHLNLHGATRFTELVAQDVIRTLGLAPGRAAAK
jgi:hypothetical protein